MHDLMEKIKEKKIQISIIGLGYIGQVIAAELASKKIKTIGIDTNQNLIQQINLGKPTVHEPFLEKLVGDAVNSNFLSATDDYSTVSDSDVIIVTVNTPIDADFHANLDNLLQSMTSLSKVIKKNQIIILKSTLPPRTTVDKVIPLLEKNSGLKAGDDFFIGFSPERLAEGKAIEEFENFPIVVGGSNKQSTKIISFFWESILNVKTILMSNPTEAELVKLADNLWIDLNISLANELAILSEKLKIDVSKVIQGANSLPKGSSFVNILFPSVGVGGSCLTKDPWFVHEFGKQYGLDLKIPTISRTINSSMPYYTLHLLEEKLNSIGKTFNNSKIGILGLSFKNNTGDLRETPAKVIISKLVEEKCNFSLFDPWVDKNEAENLFKTSLSNSIEDTLDKSDCLLVLCGHEEFHQFPKNTMKELTNKKCIFLDGRNSFNKKDIEAAGFTYQGIGR
jgi:dTDP-alpha-D-glucose dehydrogenase